MRLGLNTFLVSSGFTDDDLPLISEFNSYGAEVMELAIVEPAKVTVSKVLAALEAVGSRQPIVCAAFPPCWDLRGNEEERAASAKYISEMIDLAVALDSKVVCGPFYSSVGRTNAYTPEERTVQLELIVAGLKPLCKQAEEGGIVLAVEPLNRFETDCINTIDQAIDLIERVGSPALKIHADTFHMGIEEVDSAAAIRRAGNHIGHFHASASHRGLIGQDQVDWKGVLTALSDIGYEGDIVIESFSPGNEVIAKAASIWRTLYESPQQLAVEGLEFLRKTLDEVTAIKNA